MPFDHRLKQFSLSFSIEDKTAPALPVASALPVDAAATAPPKATTAPMANGVEEGRQMENDKTCNQQQVPPSPATQAKKMLSASVEDEAVLAVEAVVVVGLVWQRRQH